MVGIGPIKGEGDQSPLGQPFRRELRDIDAETVFARFDIVFADPPFIREGELAELCSALDNSAELLHNGTGQFDPILVVQHHHKAVPVLSRFRVIQERRAGESTLTFYQALNP